VFDRTWEWDAPQPAAPHVAPDPAPAYGGHEVFVLRGLAASPNPLWPDDRAMRAAIRAMTCLPLRWAAWQLLDACRQGQPRDARVELLDQLLLRAVPRARSSILSRMGILESTLG
jgi:hypothetical protein